LRLKTSPGNAENSLLSDDEYGRQRFELLKEKARLEELQQDFGHRAERWVRLSERTFEFACSIRERFAKGDFQAKKERQNVSRLCRVHRKIIWFSSALLKLDEIGKNVTIHDLLKVNTGVSRIPIEQQTRRPVSASLPSTGGS
jgi:hypothetical protein